MTKTSSFRLSERLGKWKAVDYAVACSRPFGGQRRLSDEHALAYGGPYLVGESMSGPASRFLAAIPMFVMRIEAIASETTCTCDTSLACPHDQARTALAYLERELNTEGP